MTRNNFLKTVVLTTFLYGSFVFTGIAESSDTTNLTGSGASLPLQLYSAWLEDFNEINPTTKIKYQPVGSGAGVRNFLKHEVDFAASDFAMNEEDMSQIEEGVQLLPMTASQIVLAFHLRGIKKLKLTRAAYSGIFLGTVKKWNDPIIATANPDIELPDLPITVVVRTSNSGTSFAFTKHLSAISPEFKSAIGTSGTPQWQEGTKLAKALKKYGVVAALQTTQGSIGYLEYGLARRMRFSTATLENSAGKFVDANIKSGIDALNRAEMPSSMVAWVPDPEGEDAYPIGTYTWLIFYKKYSDSAKTEAIHQFISYCLEQGQKMSEKMGYIPLPEKVISEVQKAAENIQ